MTSTRIASLLPSATEIVCALGLAERLVATSHECDWPPEVVGRPRVTRSRIDSQAASGATDRQVRDLLASGEPLYEIDAALLAALRPELIVTQAQCDVCAVRYRDVADLVAGEPALRDTQVVTLNPQSLSDVLGDVLRVAEAAGCRDSGLRLAAALHARIAAVCDKTSGLAAAQLPRVAIIEWIDPLMVGGNWLPELVELAGGRYDLVGPGKHSPYVAWPTLAAYDPEVLIVAPCGLDLVRTLEQAASLPRLPGWGDTSAARLGRVAAVDGNAYLNRAGPRLVDSLELLAHLIQPGLFAAPLLPRGAWRRISSVDDSQTAEPRPHEALSQGLFPRPPH
jgi:iron complex transport system substrate-binding protein